MRLCGVRACMCVLAVAVLSACASPPSKEMDQAQGAIDAARAAGAEQYATVEYTAATTALKNANDAVTIGDYRLALNHALESHEHARNAARDTANTKARMRSELERSVAEIDGRIAEGRSRITAAQKARVPARLLRQPTAALTQAEKDVQEARATIAAGDYLAASAALDGMKERLEKTLASITALRTPQTSRRRG